MFKLLILFVVISSKMNNYHNRESLMTNPACLCVFSQTSPLRSLCSSSMKRKRQRGEHHNNKGNQQQNGEADTGDNLVLTPLIKKKLKTKGPILEEGDTDCLSKKSRCSCFPKSPVQTSPSTRITKSKLPLKVPSIHPYHLLDDNEIQFLRKELCRWFVACRRQLPW